MADPAPETSPPPAARHPIADGVAGASVASRRLPGTVRALGAVSLLTDLSSEMIYPLLPLFLSGTLGASAALVGVIEGAAESTSSLLKLASGWWSDRVARRKPLVVAGYALASAARPLVALAQHASQVLAIRLVDRVGKGVRSAPRDALIAEAVPASQRGRAFGFHRAADHLGAVCGPLVAFALLRWGGASVRQVFALAAIPAALAVLVLVVWVREHPRGVPAAPAGDGAAASLEGGTVAGGAPAEAGAGATPHSHDRPDSADVRHRPDSGRGVLTPPTGALGRRFWILLGAVVLFTLGNSTDAFLILRATQLGVPVALVPVLWAMLHVVKSASSTPGGALSDRIGRRPLIVGGWTLYALVYLGFAAADGQWHAWALFAVYGLFFGLTEGTEKALVADLVPAARRGTAFGWYNLAIGLGALPASVMFGAIWDRAGPGAAFALGASLAVAAAVVLTLGGVGGRAPQRG